MKNKLSLLAVGFIMGLTHFLPGVSSGTVGLFANLYEETAQALANIREHFSISMKLLLPLVCGTLLALAAGLFAAGNLLEAYGLALRFFFLGAVLGALPALVRRWLTPRFDLLSLALLVVFFALLLICYFWQPQIYTYTSTRFDAKTFFILFGSAAFGSAAILIPGLSTTDVVHLFHADDLYRMLVTDTSCLAFILPILCGCALGFIGLAWVITYAYNRRPAFVHAMLLGCLLGSLPTLASGWLAASGKALPLILAAAGAALSWYAAGHLHIAPPDMVFPEIVIRRQVYRVKEMNDDGDMVDVPQIPENQEADEPPEE